MNVFNIIFKNTGLYGRKDVPPPCEYFIPTVKSETSYAGKDASNLTTTADISFKSQVKHLSHVQCLTYFFKVKVLEQMEKYTLLSFFAEVR